jgi:O-Antigen ligase
MMKTLSADYFVLVITCSLAVYAFSGPLITPGFVVMGLWWCYLAKSKTPLLYEKGTAIAFLLFLFWGGLGAYFFSINSAKAMSALIKVSLFFSVLCYMWAKVEVINITKLSKHRATTIAFIGVNLLILVEHSMQYPITGFFRGIIAYEVPLRQPLDKATFLLSMLLPVFYLKVFNGSALGYVGILLTSINYIINPVLAGSISYFVMIIIMIGAYYWGRRFLLLFFSAVMVYLFIAPWIFKFLTNLSVLNENLAMLPPSWFERVMIWRKTIKLIEHNMWLGYGMNCSEYTNNLTLFPGKIPLHPHNMFLQLWLEMGLIGVGLIAIFLGLLFLQIIKMKNQKLQLSLVGIISSFLVYANFSYGIWQTWLLCALGIGVVVSKVLTTLKTTGNIDLFLSGEGALSLHKST